MTLPAGEYPDGLAVADFAGDGHDDLAVLNYFGDSFPTGTVNIWMSVGQGYFNAGGTYDCGTYAREIAVGDFNGDRVPDLVVANGNSPGGVTVLLGNGDGSFQPAHTYPVPPLAYSVAVGDFTGSGISDVAVTSFGTPANDYNDGSVSVLLGVGDGTFQLADTYIVGALAESVAVADFTNDGNLDLAVENGDNRSNIHGRVSLLLGNGDGTFQDPLNYNAGRASYKVIAGDFNGDGFPDLAVSDSYSNFNILINAADWGQARPAAPVASHDSARHALHGQLQPDRLMAQLTMGASGVDLPFALASSSFATGTLSTVAATPDNAQVSDANSTAAPIAPERHPLDAAFAWWGDLGLDALALDLLQ
jgi:hypothetical protein